MPGWDPGRSGIPIPSRPVPWEDKRGRNPQPERFFSFFFGRLFSRGVV